MTIKDLHKESVCASCEFYIMEGWCGEHEDSVEGYNLCPQYQATKEWKTDRTPVSGPWVVSGT